MHVNVWHTFNNPKQLFINQKEIPEITKISKKSKSSKKILTTLILPT